MPRYGHAMRGNDGASEPKHCFLLLSGYVVVVAAMELDDNVASSQQAAASVFPAGKATHIIFCGEGWQCCSATWAVAGRGEKM